MPVKSLEFEKEAAKLVSEPILTKDNGPVIKGGTVGGHQLEKFLKAWKFTSMGYRIWEYTDRITFVKNDELPDQEDYSLFERGRIFGAGGDLSLRRDLDEFRWHFVGRDAGILPAGFDSADFWESDSVKETPGFGLREHDESALLWGNYRNELERWKDDRVGWADLDYPLDGPTARADGKRAWLHYTVFTDGGEVAFVWWKEVKSHG